MKQKVERLFTPDITLRWTGNGPSAFWRCDLVAHYRLFNQIRVEAGISGRVDDSSIDCFIQVAGRYGLTVETIESAAQGFPHEHALGIPDYPEPEDRDADRPRHRRRGTPM